MAPTKLRPINVVPILYKIWAAHHVGDMMSLQEGWINSGLHGFRQLTLLQGCFLSTALAVGTSLPSGRPLHRFAMGFAKEFDLLPRSILELGRRASMPEAILLTYGHNEQLERRFRVGRWWDIHFRATTGYAKGVPFLSA